MSAMRRDIEMIQERDIAAMTSLRSDEPSPWAERHDIHADLLAFIKA